MPRSLSGALQTHLAGNVLTLALCVKIARLDGIVLGFTSAAAPFTFDSVAYSPGLSVDVSQLRTSEGSGVDNLDFDGVLQSEAITESDLLAGRYDHASVEIFVLNYADLTQLRMVLATGTLGEAEFQDGQFRLEFRSLVTYLQQQIGELTSHLCRVKELGDFRCQLALATFVDSRSVASVVSATSITFGGDTRATGFFDYGVCEVRSGLNRAFKRPIKTHTVSAGTGTLVFQEAFPFSFAVGDVIVLTAGCDRTLSTCFTKFSNVINFQGEPYLPGNDKILRKGRNA